MRFFIPLSFFLLLSCFSYAQFPQGPGGGTRKGGGQMMNAGHLYGKIVDEKSNKPIEFAAVQLFGNKFDKETKTIKEGLVNGQLTQTNGDFSLDSVAVMGEYTLKVSALGYKPYEQKVSFKMNAQQGNMQSAMGAIDKDLGNIKLSIDAVNLPAATVTETTPAYEMKIDKKVYNVEKSLVTTGGTAEDVLKNVPSVNVDIDGNVTLRNSSPQLFVDGRPTTLTIDQIPADAIQSVEVITNPSAKYDASGGGAGILNIVLKKNRRIGYNGNVRAGVDSRGRANLGGDINARQDKINVFLSGMLNQRKSKSTNETDRLTFDPNPLSDVLYPSLQIAQNGTSTSTGLFGFGRGGFDYFMDNRNTLTLTGMYHHGSFTSHDFINTITDSIFPTGMRISSSRDNTNERDFENVGGSLAYKHNYPKDGKEWTADVNYNASNSQNEGNYFIRNYDSSNNLIGSEIRQRQEGDSKIYFTTMQTDYSNPVTDKMKVEAGARTSIRNYDNSTQNLLFVDSVNDYTMNPTPYDHYQFTDQVYAAYFTFTNQLKKFGYQAGLRAESSYYNGELLDVNRTFTHTYPVSLFPSAFFSYKLNEKNDVQLNYTRRINRPNFFQLLPYTDYSDSLNLSRGNPDLKPEFTNSFELSWQKTFSRKNTLILSTYLKNSYDLITKFQIQEFDPFLNHPVIISTYENANSSYAYGAELTAQNTITKWWDLSLNINAYNSSINGSNLAQDLTNEQFSWFGKLNSTFRFLKNFSLQVTGDYQSKTSLQVSSGGGGGDRGSRMGSMGGGGGFFGGSSSTAQGYTQPSYSMDAALKYEFLKNKMASLTLNVNDIFKTRKNETYSESPFFTQTTIRRRDQQVFRLNFSYRFGKFDVSLFKRKNTKGGNDVPDLQGGM
jgi:outer membrane receptor protein involved in Fe transport